MVFGSSVLLSWKLSSSRKEFKHVIKFDPSWESDPVGPYLKAIEDAATSVAEENASH